MSDKKLTALIKKAADATTAAWRAQNALNEYCEERWGFAPADRDIDEIIDNLFGGAGDGGSMKAADFIRLMDEAKP